MSVQDYLEPAVKDFADQAKATYSAPIDTSKFTGRSFVAQEDPLQTRAINLATQGVGSYEPFLAAAQTAQKSGAGALADSATTIGGLGALTGPQAYSPFMSPYQQQVIDTSMQAFRDSRKGNRQAIQDAAVASGNFGGGREGAMLGQYDADTTIGEGALRAQLDAQNFAQANQLAQQNFMNQGSIGTAQQGLAGAFGNQMNQQFGLSDFGRTGMGQDVSALGSLGGLRQGMDQANLSADAQAAQTGAYEPYGRLSQYGNSLTGLMGGVAGSQYQDPGQTNPFQTALGTATGLAGLFGKIYS
jgi:hypothetical protein